jgi:hypothetical protein
MSSIVDSHGVHDGAHNAGDNFGDDETLYGVTCAQSPALRKK